MSLDVLFFGAHPDDVEWGAGGMALLLQRDRRSFGIVDLTDGEMGSRGHAEERKKEGRAAAEFVGAAFRESLAMPDCGLMDTPESRRQIASAVRRHRPRIVMGPYWHDRHPDHAAAGRMVRNSALYATLRKLEDGQAPYKPEAYLYYALRAMEKPSLVVDVSAVYEQKMELLRLHRSQFGKTAEEFGVLPMGLGDYLHTLETQDRMHGGLAGVRYGEALVLDRPLRLRSVADLFA